METRRKRKPLADCTNKTPSSIKQPSLASAIKRILNDTNGKAVIKSNSKTASTTTATKENNRLIATKNCGSPAVSSTPAKPSRVSGTGGEGQGVEPCSVYSRRSTADKRKPKGKEVAPPRAVSFNTDGDKSKEDGDAVLSNPCTEHRKKKKKDDSQHALPQDFIEQQRAYFAEIDAFELSEEEVETIDQLE